MAEATQELARSSFPKLILEMTLVRLTRLEPLIGTDLLIDRLKALEGELHDAEPRGPENPELRQPDEQPEASPPKAELRPSPAADPPLARQEPAPAADPPLARQEPAPAADPPEREADSDPVPAELAAAPPETGADSDSARTDVLDTAELERLTPQARWKRVVEYLAAENKPVAMTAEHAWVEKFSDYVVELAFASKYHELINEPGRIEALEATIRKLFGDKWRVVVVAAEAESEVPRDRTLAEERDDEIKRRVQMIENELRNHHVVKEARDLFDVAADNVRVQVKLFDEE